MTPESENNRRPEVGHVLFIDLVGYSKLLIKEQRRRLDQLRGAPRFEKIVRDLAPNGAQP